MINKRTQATRRVQEKILNLANSLTLGRIILIPFVVLGFFMDNVWGAWLAFFAFLGASFTDFLDGYVARAFNQTSRFGQFLDPVADKLLVVTTLLLLAGFQRISQAAFIPAIIILCREILVSGLREFLSDVQVQIPVTWLAKCKTTLQMLALGALLMEPLPNMFLPFSMIGEGFLWAAALITLKTGYEYWRSGMRYLY